MKMVEKIKENETIIITLLIILVATIVTIIILRSKTSDLNTIAEVDLQNTVEEKQIKSGIIMTLDNLEYIVRPSDNYDLNKMVHSNDLKELIDALYEAGAEEVIVNNIKVSRETSIEPAPSYEDYYIKLNDNRINAPYVIMGIGEVDSVYNDITRPGSYYQILKVDKIPVQIEKSNNIVI